MYLKLGTMSEILERKGLPESASQSESQHQNHSIKHNANRNAPFTIIIQRTRNSKKEKEKRLLLSPDKQQTKRNALTKGKKLKRGSQNEYSLVPEEEENDDEEKKIPVSFHSTRNILRF